jgi:predicted alpha/beta hydrolase family esterase
MAYFINLRSHPVGGWLDTAAEVKIQLSPPPTATGFNQPPVDAVEFLAHVQGQHVLIGTHGFNVNFADGVAALSYWSTLLLLPDPAVFVGVLWPGDSVWAHGLDYPEEPRVADEAGQKLAPLLDTMLANAASVSFVSHSLGARVVLQAVNRMNGRSRRMMLMAGAIDDDCLTTEFQNAAQKIGTISVLASKRDEVLAWAFPLGNLVAGIIDKGHPWWHAALGRSGPSNSQITNFMSPFQIPDNWCYGHHDYLQDNPPYTGPPTTGNVNVPRNGSGWPLVDGSGNPWRGWQEAWSSAFVSTRFK